VTATSRPRRRPQAEHPHLRSQAVLTYEGAAVVLRAAIAKARELGVPQVIAVVDAHGRLLAFARLDGAHFLAQHAATAKAETAASLASPTGGLAPQLGMDLALATGARSVNLAGGLPLLMRGELVGAVGVSSGSPEEDVTVAQAAVAAFNGSE
jgi:glc operon protein GlcG